MEESTVNVYLLVLKTKNKNTHDEYCLQNVPLFGGVARFKAYLFKRCQEELRPAADYNFSFWRIQGENICSEDYSCFFRAVKDSYVELISRKKIQVYCKFHKR